jgi:hypothetical protein
MATKHPRRNITFDAQTDAVLAFLAKQENKSVSAVTKELVLEALDRREDLFLSTLAEQRESKAQKRIPHDKAWK